MALAYPNTLRSVASGVPFVTFSFRDGPLVGPGSGLGKKVGEDIILFMPPAFQIADGHDYEFKEGGLLTQVAQGAIQDSQSILGILGSIVAGAAQKIGANQTLGGAAEGGAASLGAAIRDPKFFNYKEPKAREFSFNYKFEPKNKEDAKSMMEIIKRFRAASYPTLIDTKLYGVPLAVNITFVNFDSSLNDGGGRTTLFELVIKDMNTTLSEGDQVLTFDDGIPTQISMQLQLAETYHVTRDGSGNLQGKPSFLGNGVV